MATVDELARDVSIKHSQESIPRKPTVHEPERSEQKRIAGPHQDSAAQHLARSRHVVSTGDEHHIEHRRQEGPDIDDQRHSVTQPDCERRAEQQQL